MGYECLLTGLPDPGMMKMEALEELLDETLTERDKKQLQLLKSRSRNGACKFVQDWLTFTKRLNNVLTTEVCKKHGLDPSKYIIGAMPDEVPPEWKAVSREADLSKREHDIDTMYLTWLDERTEGIYFSLENVLAYYLKSLVYTRWDDLTTEKGEEVFRDLVADMKKDVSF